MCPNLHHKERCSYNPTIPFLHKYIRSTKMCVKTLLPAFLSRNNLNAFCFNLFIVTLQFQNCTYKGKYQTTSWTLCSPWQYNLLSSPHVFFSAQFSVYPLKLDRHLQSASKQAVIIRSELPEWRHRWQIHAAALKRDLLRLTAQA